MKGERFTRWVASAANEQALVAMQQFYGDASQIKAQAPAGRRVLSAGSRFSLSGTSCPDSGARHPWRACCDPRPPGHGSPRRQLGPFGFNKCRDDELPARRRSEEHKSELQSLMRISHAVFCLKKQ